MSLILEHSRLGRRSFLKAAGVSVALPWAESLLASTDRSEPPVRFAALFMPNGVFVPSWQPRKTGIEWELTPSLAPLAERRQDLFVFTGLRNRNSFSGEGHYVKTTALLSGAKVKKTGGRDLRCGRTLDQLMAQRIGQRTPLPSLELSIEPVRNIVDMGFSTVYGGHISWRTATTPAAREIDPRLAFDRLFRTAGLADPSTRLLLDTVREDARRLAKHLGGADRDKIGEYLDSVHEVEKRVRAFATGERQKQRDLTAGRKRSEFDPRDHSTRVRLMLELMVLAFRADITRVATLMFGNAVSAANFSFVDGVRGAYHPLSHHQNDPEKTTPYALINRWHVAEYAWFLDALAAIDEGGMSLLDRSMILFASGIGDGNRHDPKSLPVLLAGSAGGQLVPGRHLVYRDDRRLCNLHLSMLHAMGIDLPRFGDGTRVLHELFV